MFMIMKYNKTSKIQHTNKKLIHVHCNITFIFFQRLNLKQSGKYIEIFSKLFL